MAQEFNVNYGGQRASGPRPLQYQSSSFIGTIIKAVVATALVAFLFGAVGFGLLIKFLESFPLWLMAILIVAGILAWRRRFG